jgi:hypothetical protein
VHDLAVDLDGAVPSRTCGCPIRGTGGIPYRWSRSVPLHVRPGEIDALAGQFGLEFGPQFRVLVHLVRLTAVVHAMRGQCAGLWVPRTVSRPLTSAFPACEAATTNC